MASFDVRSLFTNVPLLETINICADFLLEENILVTVDDSFYLDVLFEEEHEPELTKEGFIELMKLATSKTEFSINNCIYRQIDGVAMGSPLGPTLANVFMGYLENRYFAVNERPLLYYRYVDDCFILFRNKSDCLKMFKDFNLLHDSISFTMESEDDNRLSFLDVLVTRTSATEFITSIFRKKTFTGQYINFLSHCSRKRKINLIKTLCHRAVTICSPSALEKELETITSILEENGYPSQLISKTIKHHRAKLAEPKVIGAERCHIPIKLPFLGEASIKLERELKMLVRQCYYSVEPRVVFSSKPIVNHVVKDHIPVKDTSMVVYHFQCCCENSYVGQTARRLGDRIKEHIPPCVTKHYQKTPDADYRKNSTLNNAARRSAISEHLLKNKKCGLAINETKFSILRKCLSTFQLHVYESVLIAAMEPSLCKQREFDFVTSFI